MSFLETVEKARAFLERNGRVSLRALQREFDLDDDALDELIEELAEIQRVAVRDGRALAWAGGVPPAPTETPEPRARPPRLHPQAPRRQDPPVEVRPGGRAQAGHGALRRRQGLDGAGRAGRSRGVARDPRPLLPDPDRRGAPLRGHRQPVHRRRHHGALRRADRPRGPRPAGLLRGAASARRAARATRDELRMERSGLSFSTRMGLNSGEVVVGKIGDDLRMDYTAQGHTVGLAQRMEAARRPTACLPQSSTRRGWSRATSSCAIWVDFPAEGRR